MRPHTLSEAVSRIQEGIPAETALGEFLDHFYTSADAERIRSLSEEPAEMESAGLNALVGAIAEHLTRSYTRAPSPTWTNNANRFLSAPWFSTDETDASLREYLTWASPAAFKRRNIMTDAAPLRRATTPQSLPLLTR